MCMQFRNAFTVLVVLMSESSGREHAHSAAVAGSKHARTDDQAMLSGNVPVLTSVVLILNPLPYNEITIDHMLTNMSGAIVISCQEIRGMVSDHPITI